MKNLLWLFLIPFCAHAGSLYQIHDLYERELVQTYTNLLRDACLHSDQFWTNSSVAPGAGYWGDGVSDGNEGIRAVTEMVLTCGTLLKYSEAFTPAERRDYLAKATGAIRYATATHRTGDQQCTNGKQWGGSWQSAMWTGTLGFGAWLLWDNLDAGLRQDLERVIASESDRFLKDRPPSGLWGDTKAEENGWNLICLAIAVNMFPGHPHAAAWQDKALEYMMNTLSTPQDLQDATLTDGRAVKDWVVGPNLQPDYTLENHYFFHPSYVACSSYFLTQTAMYYRLAGRPIPAAAAHHLLDTWRMFQTILLPSSESAFPQGMDWELHGLSFINLYAALGTYDQDPLAARMEQLCLQYMRVWQLIRHGDLAVPGSRLGFTRHAICAEQASYGFLAHKIFGPARKELTARKAGALEQGVRDYPFVDFIMQRTPSKFFSFSWKNKMMGMLIPLGGNDNDNPFFTSPVANGFLGDLEFTRADHSKPKLLEHSRRQLPNGFETTGTLLADSERLKQIISVTSLGDKTVVYQDRVLAQADVALSRELGVPLGIENDEVSGGQRVIYYQGGQTSFEWGKPRPPMNLPGAWANVDGRLGIVAAAGSGLAYCQARGYDPHMAVCSDLLCGSFSDHRRTFKAGELVARRIVLVFTDVSPAKTAALSRAFKIEDGPTGHVLHFKLPEGAQAELPLL